MITEYLETSVLSNVLPQKLVVVQNDSGRNVNVNIVDYKIPAEAAARIWVIKPDGKVVWNNCDIITDQIVKVKLTNQMLAVVGLSKAKIEIYTEDEVLSTFNFYLQVEEDISDPNGTESKNESTALEEIANKIKDYEITVEKGLTSIENKIAEVVDTADGKMRDIDTLTSAKLTDINNTALSQIDAINNTAISQLSAINTVASNQIDSITNVTNQQLGNINAAATHQIEMIENKTSIQIDAINKTAQSQIKNMNIKYSDMCRTFGIEHEGIMLAKTSYNGNESGSIPPDIYSIDVSKFKYIEFGKLVVNHLSGDYEYTLPANTISIYLTNLKDNSAIEDVTTGKRYDVSLLNDLQFYVSYIGSGGYETTVNYKLYNKSEETTTE